MADGHSGNPESFDPMLSDLADDFELSTDLNNIFSLRDAFVFPSSENGMNSFDAAYHPEIDIFPFYGLADAIDVVSSSELGPHFVRR